MISILPFFEWCEQLAVGQAIQQSVWLFPVIESAHLLGLALLGGATLLVDLRLLGFVLRDHSVAALWRDVRAWVIGGILLMFASGIPLFLSEAVKCYHSFPFWVKMFALFAAIVFTFTIRQRLVASDGAGSVLRSRLVAAASLTFWALVGWGGRWIGFS